ncbi:unnamed protein product [Blepharisma stoltei]|uniref:CRAL-TRIO domain-containing protein n=1 Tax=Blepharisma stoltei TaxID=1481888 RepID=A0AAU9JLP7_9CILI|nr:unnamed protein product [Blepharisma stoltei]
MGNNCCSSRGNNIKTSQIGISEPEITLVLRLSRIDPPITHPCVERYDWREISQFLKANNYNVDAAFESILDDINWRIDNLPITKEQHSDILITREIFVFRHDVKNHPVIVIRPFYSDTQPMSLNFCLYLTYFFENIQPSLKGFKRKITLLIDFNNNLLNENAISVIWGFMKEHYPNRIFQILVIQASIVRLPEESRAILRKIPTLSIFDSNFKANIIKFIDPENLMEEYGGLRQYYFKGNDDGVLPQKNISNQI